jgi:erythromycin esterase-like protein
MFERLVQNHGYSAIAIETSFPRAPLVDDHLSGRNETSFEDVLEKGFSHGFGKLAANRELIEWMRRYNADASHQTRLRFYGFDAPTEMTGADGPRQLLTFAVDYLASIDPPRGSAHRQRIEPLIGDDAAWENPAALMDPSKSIGLSPQASELRIATEELISDLRVRMPELIRASDRARFLEAKQHAVIGRQLLTYHAGLARSSPTRVADLLGIRDAMMADNLAYAVNRERTRGKVFAFAHNSHLQRGLAGWQLGPQMLEWWPAGALVSEMLGAAYAVIGAGVGVSHEHGIGTPESETLEAKLLDAPGPARFVPTHRGQGISGIDQLPTRSGSSKNSTYFPLTSRSLTDFDWLVVLDSMAS